MGTPSRSESSQETKSLDWMYKGPASLVDRDDYLQGRQIDKALHILNEAEKGNSSYSYLDDVQKDLTPVSIFAKPSNAGPIDVIRKIKEDPLYQIQKKEEESLRQLLNNPVKMKKLREMKEKMNQSDESKSGRRRPKKRRGSKSKSSSSSESSSSDSDSDAPTDIDKLLAQKLTSVKDVKGLLGKSKLKPSPADREASSSTSKYGDNSKSSHSSSSRSSYSSRESSSSRDSKYTRDNDSNRLGRGYDGRSRDRQSSSSASSSSRRYDPAPKRNALDDEEKQRRLKEMMDNAKWREDERTRNVNQQREAMKREEEKQKSKHNAEFIRKQLVQAAETGSVEKRIKSNSYNIQRGNSSMNQNFVRR